MKVIPMFALLAFAVVASLVVLPASPASAAIPGLHDVEVQAAFGAPGRQISGSAQCPAGESLLSIGAGNADLTGFGHSSQSPGVARAVGAPIRPSPLNFLFLQATCAPFAQVPAGTVTVVAVAPASTSTLRTATARCRPGEIAYGGGGYLVPAQSTNPSLGGSRMVGSMVTADGTGWRVTVHTRQLTDTLHVRALCARLPGALLAPAVQAPRTVLVTTAGGYHSCPSSMQPLSGGAYIDNGSGGDSASARLEYSNRVPHPSRNGWFAAANNMQANDRLFVRVLCI
ncbi:hypothetical protein [Cryptosporangium aurantiacum]|uniref:Uncharacterized protein n=1 Tax=Cryptosporangium aurantiacum TaxID=134849 RepID=A0A1M7Q4B1_9ACTN|nr:hypothetical protein [Cryptosporangium aurantiacum]SHN25156.1 hypothetical protein SAMN05443668_104135 [Cryptosporangium aurantiacum]